ncbi:helix-hairpin-helix domain-containing protein [Corticibacter populi]|uniref:Helix-hairpin-helix domain-containing protein n=1 Tax=Corticibacter populi TaxID=1550736 RepID=A0A3M6QRD8_9BURK|nr:helix-hairpin-helix domain-containing protein [Corticibacter populi]RMX05615.1 helix-hairpin-helix domain-containing protein [Corticibacter populi]RZS31115.1 competence protein ComEA [Corticibacter populi]
MFRQIIATVFAFWAASVFAADVNQASAQELTQIKGIGPALAERIIEERGQSDFKDWEDFIQRVKGVGATKAASLSAEGLRVKEEAYEASKPAASQ